MSLRDACKSMKKRIQSSRGESSLLVLCVHNQLAKLWVKMPRLISHRISQMIRIRLLLTRHGARHKHVDHLITLKVSAFSKYWSLRLRVKSLPIVVADLLNQFQMTWKISTILCLRNSFPGTISHLWHSSHEYLCKRRAGPELSSLKVTWWWTGLFTPSNSVV